MKYVKSHHQCGCSVAIPMHNWHEVGHTSTEHCLHTFEFIISQITLIFLVDIFFLYNFLFSLLNFFFNEIFSSHNLRRKSKKRQQSLKNDGKVKKIEKKNYFVAFVQRLHSVHFAHHLCWHCQIVLNGVGPVVDSLKECLWHTHTHKHTKVKHFDGVSHRLRELTVLFFWLILFNFS